MGPYHHLYDLVESNVITVRVLPEIIGAAQSSLLVQAESA